MVRNLHHHEQKLLKKVDFLSVCLCLSIANYAHFVQWKQDAGLREIKVLRRYHIQNRDDYHKYNKLCGSLRSFAHRVALLPAQDPFRATMEGQILSKLYDMGVLNSSAKLSDVDNKLTVAAFCRRRLAVFMCMSKMSETVSVATKFIEQGHVRVGPDTITDPAFLVTRHMEDFVTWVDTSKLKRTVMQYNDEVSYQVFALILFSDDGQLDDFDLL
ncbi:U3 small nucleolar ribonucleoprotein IMP3 [Leucoagaricus sp. SymC.cos]|nr:U3 small nucleolar ribonucleoprotein IMP3 [Leucoagaricus sp. SymC.cos]